MSDRFGVIDPSALGDMTVIDVPNVEDILRRRMVSFKQRWMASDPTYAAAFDTDNIEFEPARVVNEVGTNYQVNVLSRVNQAAKDTTLAFGYGTNLDGIATRYPGGVPRLALVENPRPFASFPEDWEADDRFRKRIWLAANALTTAGAAEAYEFWAMTAAPTLRDVTATVVKTQDGPVVRITCLNDGPDPMPTADQTLAVRKVLDRRDVRPLTDIVSVGGPAIFSTDYLAKVFLYPGPDASTIEKILNDRLALFLDKARFLGHDHTELAFSGLLNIDGITHSAIRYAPATSILVDDTQFVRVTGTPRIEIAKERLK